MRNKRLAAVMLVWFGATGCTARSGATVSPSAAPGASATPAPATAPQTLLERAQLALDEGNAARAVALYGRLLTGELDDPTRRAAYPGLARAHEELGNCRAAVRAYDGYLERFGAETASRDVFARRGACEAEIGAWERSAASYAAALELGSAPAIDTVEWLARQGYALFHLDRFDDADALLVAADELHERVVAEASERFATFYFVGMARFYRAAIAHRRFRQISIRAGREEMEADYEAKLELLLAAQDRYKAVIKVKHVFWVSAAGYQWGALFTEFYDALMYAPVPEWLDAEERKIYFEELKTQIRPILNDAIWVFEKNLEAARKLGYDNRFVEETRAELDALQRVLSARNDLLGQPHPPIAPDARVTQDSPEYFPAADPADIEHRLFVPAFTPL
ncbi:MAG: hypothetical protein B7733_24310 [Myxococcales bacterium FL481]|nr:MAG: hypothetical protein B7733_24310 [Myxococcales bacterium FL481]